MKPFTSFVLGLILMGTVGCGGNNNPQPPAAPPAVPGAPPVPGVPAPGVPVPGAPPPAQTPPGQQPPPAPGNPNPPPAVPTDPAKPAPGQLVPPRGQSSNGQGGQAGLDGQLVRTAQVEYYLFVPNNYRGAPTPFLLVFTGVEGAVRQSAGGLVSPLPGEVDFLKIWIPQVGLSNFIICIIDTPAYYQKGIKNAALAPLGAAAMDDVRAKYNIDNDRMNLLGESMGTHAGEEMGFRLRQSYFASYYLNDVTSPVEAPAQNVAQLGFTPDSQVGPGGAYETANGLVANLRAAGYRLPPVAPYNGPGSNQHGSPVQLMEAYRFFAGKVRR
jgi:hypothetical protein